MHSTLSKIALVITFVAGLHVSVATRADEEKPRPIRALLVIGGCCHDYGKQKDVLTAGVAARANVVWTVAYDDDKTDAHQNPVYDRADWAAGYDVIVHDECSSWVSDMPTVERILKPHRDGLPAVVLHCGMHSYRTEGYPDAVTPWFAFTGVPSTGHGPQLPIAVTYVDRDSPITSKLEDWTTINEELYNNSAGKLLDTARALARGKQTIKNKEGETSTDESVVAWTNTYAGKTRVFATTLGHNTKTVADGRYLDLVTRGLLWSVDKLDDKNLKPAQKPDHADEAGKAESK